MDTGRKSKHPEPGYLKCPGENTDMNTTKSGNKLSGLLPVFTYLAVWAAALISFWVFKSGSDAMGYSVVYLWILLPITTFFTSLVIGINNYWGRKKWISVAAYGVMYMLAGYATFSVANMITFNKINMPEFIMIPIGAAISAAGMGLGTGIRIIRK